MLNFVDLFLGVRPLPLCRSCSLGSEISLDSLEVLYRSRSHTRSLDRSGAILKYLKTVYRMSATGDGMLPH